MANPFKGAAKALKNPQVYWPVIIIILAILVGVVTFFIAGRIDDALVVGLGVAIIGLMIVVLRLFITMEREDRSNRGVDEPRAAPSPGPGRESLAATFGNAVADIRGSRLGSGGVDKLPWLLMLGESGEGKTAAVAECGLELPAEYATRVSGAPTASCDWWLTNDAIILDLAGRYLACEDEETHDDWKALLRLLQKQRPGCALNGILFAISVDSLLTKSAEELDEVARSLRRRVNDVTDTLGVDLPIYVLVTKLDHVEGLVDCITASSTMVPTQALGWTNDQPSLGDAEARVNEGFRPFLQTLEGVLPELLLRSPDRAGRRRVFAFPAEVEEVIRAAARFCARAFSPTRYDLQPFLRGVYLTSARREGSTVSPQLHRLGNSWACNAVDGKTAPGGLFLRDVLGHEIVLGDRELALPVDRFGRGPRRAMNAAAGFLFALFAMWWLISFGNNFLGIRELSREAEAVADGAASLTALDAMRSTIQAEGEDMRVLRRGGMASTLETALARARQTYVWGFGREYESIAKQKLITTVTGFGEGAFEALTQLATDVTWMADPGEGARPDIARYADIPDNETDREVFRRNYDAFVRWASPSDLQQRIHHESEVLGEQAPRQLELARLESWAQDSRQYPTVRYSDFGLAPRGESGTEVNGAYTRAAWGGLVSRLLDAIDATQTGGENARTFRTTYVSRYDEKWRELLMDTPQPRRSHAQIETSPYLDFIDTLHDNSQAELPRREPRPDWMLALFEAHREEVLEPPSGGDDEAEKEKPPPPPWTTYEDSLKPIAADVEKALADGETAIGLAKKMADRKGTSFEKALDQVRAMVPSGRDADEIQKLESILEMPILDAASAVIDSAFADLEQQWQALVVEPSRGRSSSSRMKQLYGAEGGVAKFRAGPLQPFYQNHRPRRVLGDRAMPFGGRFLAWMKSADELQRVYGGSSGGGSVVVRLGGMPAPPPRVQSGEKLRVTQRQLTLTCGGVEETWNYYEGMGKHSFNWSPDCVDFRLLIFVKSDAGGPSRALNPPKRWSGSGALPAFLQQGRRSGNELHWTMDYPEHGVTVEMAFQMLQGMELRGLVHKSPPSSMRE